MGKKGYNCNYKPDEDEVFMYLDDLKKSGWTDYKGMMINLHIDYGTLTEKEIKKFMYKWLIDRKLVNVQ